MADQPAPRRRGATPRRAACARPPSSRWKRSSAARPRWHHPGPLRSWIPLEDCASSAACRGRQQGEPHGEGRSPVGLKAAGYTCEPDELRTMPLPMIVFWNFNHFVVVEGFGKARSISRPAQGRARLGSGVRRVVHGRVLVFEKTRRSSAAVTSPISSCVVRRLRGSEGALLYAVLAGLGLVVPGLSSPPSPGSRGRCAHWWPERLAEAPARGHGRRGGVAERADVAAGACCSGSKPRCRCRARADSCRTCCGFRWCSSTSGSPRIGRASGSTTRWPSSLRASSRHHHQHHHRVSTRRSCRLRRRADPAAIALRWRTCRPAYVSRKRSTRTRSCSGAWTAHRRFDGGLQMIEDLKATGPSRILRQLAGRYANMINAEHASACTTPSCSRCPAARRLRGGGPPRDRWYRSSRAHEPGHAGGIPEPGASFAAPMSQLVGWAARCRSAATWQVDDVLRYETDRMPWTPSARPRRSDRPTGGASRTARRDVRYSRFEPPLIEGLNLVLSRANAWRWSRIRERQVHDRETRGRILRAVGGRDPVRWPAEADVPRRVLNDSLAFVDQEISSSQARSATPHALGHDCGPRRSCFRRRETRASTTMFVRPDAMRRDGGAGANFSGGQRSGSRSPGPW